MFTTISAVGQWLGRCRYIGSKSEKMQNLSRYRALVWAALILLSSGCGSDQSNLELTNGYVRMPPPGMGMTAAFGTLDNLSDSTLSVVAFSSPQFADVSLHRTVLQDGVAKMREVTSLNLEPGEQLEMKPGGYHLMLMGSKQALAVDDQVAVQWEFADGTFQKVFLSVQKR